MVFLGAATARHLIDAPGVGCFRMPGERAAERNDRPHPIRHHLGELPCIKATEAPADQADLAPMRVTDLVDEIDHALLHPGAQAEIAALPPAADGIAFVFQEAAQWPGR